MATSTSFESKTSAKISLFDRLIYQLSRKWLLVFSLLYGSYVGLPFLAPVFKQIGWAGPAKGIYLIYWFGFPLLEEAFNETARTLKTKLQRSEANMQ